MLYRSTSAKFTHHQGDFLSNTDDGSSHGVHLTGGSTGGIVQPCGDEDNIALTVRGKGTGPLILGSTHVIVGGSTTLIAIQKYVVQFTPPAVEASSWADLSTITVTGLATNSALFGTFRQIDMAPSTLGSYVFSLACSTAG